jgi:hypothetical protein
MKYRAVLACFHGRTKGDELRERQYYKAGEFYTPTKEELTNRKAVDQAIAKHGIENLFDHVSEEVFNAAVPMHFVPEKEWSEELCEQKAYEDRMRFCSITTQKNEDLSADDAKLIKTLQRVFASSQASA